MSNPANFTTAADASTAPEGADATDFAIEAARLLNDFKCEDVMVFDVRGLSELTNHVILASGTSDRQMRSLADDLEDLGKAKGFERYGAEGDDAATWIVADFVEVVVHLFEPATRAHYDLEMLWGDAPQVKWRRV